MAPPPLARAASIERTDEYNDFIANLAIFHQNRGTTFDPEPKVGSRRVDLLRLFQEVVHRGGYDKVSAKKLEWRHLGNEFLLGDSNQAALAFNLKTAYYKNVAAYELKTVFGQEPPPKEILEDLSARGADLRNRTIENYRHRAKVDNFGGNDDDSDNSGHTPKADGQSDGAGATGSRGGRGLRTDPIKRVLFQPDVPSPRQVSRSGIAHHGSPSQQIPALAPSTVLPVTSNSYSRLLKTPQFAPRQRKSHPLRAAITPASHPAYFKERARKILEKRKRGDDGPDPYRGAMLPGTGFGGPNIYIRALNALKSGLPDEIAFALNHLVKISFERGDKFRFEQFPGLFDALGQTVLDACSLFSRKPWEIIYDSPYGGADDQWNKEDWNKLNGFKSTSNIIERAAYLKSNVLEDGLVTNDFATTLRNATEATLIIRNLVINDDNARYFAQSNFGLTKDLVALVLLMPINQATREMRSNAVEILELTSKHFHFSDRDPLIHLLLEVVKTEQTQGVTTSALKALSRASMLTTKSNFLHLSEKAVIERVTSCTLLEDEEDLVFACLDFLYLYTSASENVKRMLSFTSAATFVQHLTRLMTHGAKVVEERDLVRNPIEHSRAPRQALTLPDELIQKLLEYDEPLRSSWWLKASFEPVPDAEITQLALWQMYTHCFYRYDRTEPYSNKPRIVAADFIKNVSATFGEKYAKAEVMNVSGSPTYIIRGISYRRKPIDPQGTDYVKCWWVGHRLVDGEVCGHFSSSPDKLLDHIMTAHLECQRAEGGKWEPMHPDKAYKCNWTGCTRYAHASQAFKTVPDGALPPQAVSDVALHVGQHLPDKNRFNVLENERSRDAEYKTVVYRDTPYEDRSDAHGKITREPKGIALGATLLLINLARAMKEVSSPIEIENAFSPVKATIWNNRTINRTLANQLTELIEVAYLSDKSATSSS